MKRFLSLLLVAALVLSIPVAPVFAQTTTTQEDNVTPMTDLCPCGCGKKIEEVDWTPMPTGYMGSIPEGHLYLTQDYLQSTYGMTIIAGTKVVIDLRGYTWGSKGTTNRILTVQGDMWVMDTVGGGKMAPKLEDNNTGGAILLDTYELNHPSFTLVSGTLTAGEGSGATNSGGFVYAREDSKFIMLGGVIENVSTKNYGGAIYAAGTASVEILGGTIRDCFAGIRGGAIYSDSSTPVVLKNTTFINNKISTNTKAANGGGAIYSVPGLTVENCTFMGNSSTSDGGAVYAGGGLDMKNSTFIGNSANNGGDIGCSGTVASVIDGCKFYGGSSKYNADGGGGNGGSIHASDTNLTIKDSLMMGAIADKQGGHIYQYGGTVTIENSTLNGGISNWEGSVYCGGGNLFALNSAVTTITDSTIRNGFAKVYGGNIAMAATTLTLNNSTVTGGVAKYRGNNIGAQSASTVTINGGTIDGDIYIPAGKPITLKGKVNIGLRNNGLAVGANANIDASGLAEESMVYISGTGNLVAAGANAEYFKGAIRTELSGGGETAITGTAGNTGYCPHCMESVDWVAYSGQTTSGHYYLTADRSSIVTHDTESQTVVVDLAGKKVTSTTARAITSYSKSDLSLLDSVGNAMVTGNGGTATGGGGMSILNGTTRIYGGNYAVGGAKETFGGVLYNRGTMTVYGGYFDGSLFNCEINNTGVSGEAKAGRGATVYVLGGKSMTISGGHFVGGTAYNGGNLWSGAGSTLNITGGTFVGGTATNSGGSVYISDSTAGTINIENAVIRGGKATLNGGNLRAGKAPTYTVENCYIAEGSVTSSGSYGGNISLNTSGRFADCVIYGGQSAGAGGNVYAAGTTSTSIFDGCLITGGTASTSGGNIMFNHGYHQILGGEVSCGTANDKGGNIYTNAGNYANRPNDKVVIDKNSKGEAPQIFSGYAKLASTDKVDRGGGNLYISGVVELKSATIYGGEATEKGQDIWLDQGKVKTQLTVGDGVTGGATGKISMIASVTAPVFGATIPNTACEGLNEKAAIVLEGDYGEPNILAKGGVLRVAGAQVVDAEDKETWYVDYADAAAAVSEGGYVKLFADAQLIVTKDTYVDLNGHDVTVTGNGKLLGMDTSGDNYDEPEGKVTFTGTSPVADKSIVYAPNGNKYVALVADSTVTYHRLGADLTTVTIDVDNNGVYFKGKFGADLKLKPMIDTYGIAVSLDGMPKAENIEGTIKTKFQGGGMTNNETTSGVIITNILKETLTATENQDRGNDKIYASAYVKLTDGTTVFMGDDANDLTDDVAWSLQDALCRLDELIDEDPTLFRRYTNTMRAYYEKWKDMGLSELVNANTNFIEPEKDDVIDVLMIGSSSCYYYVEEMASLAAAAGIKLRVCNVYYSGCPIDKYYEDWKNNYADYQFFDTTAEEQPDGTIKATRKVLGGGKTLEWCLAQGDWDIISMQSTGRLVMRDYLKSVDHLEASDIKEATEFMFPYIQSQFPNAHLYIREQSAYQVGKVLSISGISSPYKFENLEDQQEYAFAQKDASVRMVEKFNAAPYNLNMRLMPASQAMMLVREGFGQWEGYDQLCARIGFRPTSPDISFDANDKHEGDHGHVGDIGGGQYVEAALWLQVIMQDYYDADFDVRDITWVPTYTSSGEVVPNRFDAEFMREAAYKAAKEGWTPPANFVSPVK